MKVNDPVKLLLLMKDTQSRLMLQDLLEPLGIVVIPCDDEKKFFEFSTSGNFDLAIVSHGKSEFHADNILRKASALQSMPVIVLASECSIEDAIRIMQAGAEDLILYPWEKETVKVAIEGALINFPLRQKKSLQRLRQKQRNIVCKSPKMFKVLEIARNIAPSKASVLIQGESGTGKELLARFIHQESDRRNGPFVAVNCAALPDTLLESELFGHEKGAFTGAVTRKKGKFELADKGTILLDEVTEMAVPLQAKLLRILQEGEIDRLGSTSPVSIDVRVIATTNRDIKQAISEGKFREDLYFRLNVIPLTLPPLRSRTEDIPLLADHFLEEFSKEYGKVGLIFANNVMEELMSRRWQGNIRELRNIIERGVLLARGREVTLEDLFFDENEANQPEGSSEGAMALNDMFNLQDVEREIIKKALVKTGGNRTHAAKLLGISVRTLRNKLSEYRKMGLVL